MDAILVFLLLTLNIYLPIGRALNANSFSIFPYSRAQIIYTSLAISKPRLQFQLRRSQFQVPYPMKIYKNPKVFRYFQGE